MSSPKAVFECGSAMEPLLKGLHLGKQVSFALKW